MALFTPTWGVKCRYHPGGWCQLIEAILLTIESSPLDNIAERSDG